MATLIDWSAVEAQINGNVDLYEYESRSQALAHTVLERLFGLSAEEIGEDITDGSKDRGIDAVHVEESVDGVVVHLFQFKTVSSFDKRDNNFPSSEIDKILSFVSDLLAKKEEMQDICNAVLWEKILEIWGVFDQGTPKFVIHLASNTGELTPEERKRLESALSPYRIFHVKEHSLTTIARLLIESKTPQLDRELRLVDNQYFERVDGNIRGLVATIEANELISIIRDPEEPSDVVREIFDENVRIYLTSRNKINKKIIESALSDDNSQFWYLNNGITITCDSIEYPPGVRAPLVKLKNVQIVNGGQTSNALFEASKANGEAIGRVLVLVRIYEAKSRDISSKIAETTNSQTPIKSRDLRANDEVQRKLEEAFLARGYYYERKTNQHKEQEKAARIDALSAGQAYTAYYLDMPDVAGKDRGKVFGELYDTIFNDSITADRLLTPLQVYKPIESMKRELQANIRQGEEYDRALLLLVDGSYHVLFAASLLCSIKGIDKSDAEAAKSQIEEALDIVKRAAEREMEDPAFAYKRFFKSTRSKRYIQEEAARGMDPRQKQEAKPADRNCGNASTRA